jgi:putative membrane protein
MTRPLTPEQHAELAERIREAESRTSGEIYCVVARQSDDYFFPAAFMVLAGIVLVGVVMAFWLDGRWFAVSHTVFALAELLAGAAALLVLRVMPGWRVHLTPRGLRYRRAHDNAVKQFIAHNVHLTEKRTGVLVFVSLAERYAEVVADSGINARVSQDEWTSIVAGLVDKAKTDRLHEGLAEAIDRAAALLAAHFPGGRQNPNELDDHVVEM